MVDVALQLSAQRPGTRLVALSRGGLLPHAHRTGGAPPSGEIPLPEAGSSLRQLLRFVRASAAAAEVAGGDWRDTVNALRPVTHDLWAGLPLSEQRRFVDRLSRFWDTHRHRLAPQVATSVEQLRRSGRLVIESGRICSVSSLAGGLGVSVLERTTGRARTLKRGLGRQLHRPERRRAQLAAPGGSLRCGKRPPAPALARPRHRPRRRTARRLREGVGHALRDRPAAPGRAVGDDRRRRDPGAGTVAGAAPRTAAGVCGIEPASVTQAALRLLERTQASTNATPFTPSSTVGKITSRIRRLARARREDGRGGLLVDRGEALEIALGMSRRDTGHARSRGARAGASARDQPLGLAEGREPEVVRILLGPLQAALRAVDAQYEAVLVAGRHLARPEHAARAALVAQHDVDVVVELAALDEGRQLGRDRLRLGSGDEAGEVVGVRADVADRAARTGARRIGAPLGLLLAARLDRRS